MIERMVKLILFDFDGTIVDSFDVVYNIQKDLEKKFKLGVFTSKRAFRDIYMGNFYVNLRKRTNKKDLSQYKAECEKLNIKAARRLKVFGGLKKALSVLKNKFRIVIVSSNFSPVIKKVLKKEGIAFFDDVLGADAGESKVEKIKDCLKRFNTAKKDAVFVGDTVGDLLEARKAGVRTIAVAWGFHGKNRLIKASPDKLVSRPEQLVSAVEGL